MLHAEIFRWALGDCSNAGISSRVKGVTIVNANGPTKDATDDYPAVIIVKGPLPGTVHIKPAIVSAAMRWVPDPRWHMMGGTFIWSSDSRFAEAVAEVHNAAWATIPGLHNRDPLTFGPVAFHDRRED